MMVTDFSFQRECSHSRHSVTKICVCVPVKRQLWIFSGPAVIGHSLLSHPDKFVFKWMSVCLFTVDHTISMSSPESVFLSTLFFAGSHRPRTASSNGKWQVNIRGVNEWRGVAHMESNANGVPPHRSQMLLSSHPCSSPASPHRRCSSTVFPIFPRRASLTSELFHFLHKNKYPARGRVQHSPGCQNKPFLPAFPGQQQTQDDLPDLFAKMY